MPDEKIIRRFERHEKKPQWWSIVCEGRQCTTYFGKIGAGPPKLHKRRRVSGAQTTTKKFPTEEKAFEDFKKQCETKLAAGFFEVGIENSSGRGALLSAWKRIESWMSCHAPTNCEFPLAVGIADAKFVEAEKHFGFSVPADFKKSYARHNGSNYVSIFAIFGLGYWMPLPDVVSDWEGMTTLLESGVFEDPGFVSHPKGPIRKDHWNRKWVPFTCAHTGDFLAIDLAPAKGGKKGQIIYWWHEVGAVTVVAESFTDLICQFASQLERGIYTFNEYSALRPANDAVATDDQLLALFENMSSK